MRRREFVALLGGVAAAPLVVPRSAGAQQRNRLPRIGIFSGFSNAGDNDLRTQSFRQQLQALGWTEGRNVEFDYRQIGEPGRLAAAAAELVASKPDVMLVMPTPALQALSKATSTIPIVFANVSDPVEGGFVASLARPGGNVTGFTAFEYTLGGKWLELLRDFAPNTRRVLVLLSLTQGNYTSRGLLRAIEQAGPALGITVIAANVDDLEAIDRAIESFAVAPGGALITLPHPLITNNNKRVFALATLHRLPAIYPFRQYALNGGLVTYGSIEQEAYRGAATYVDRILKGAKPGDLPVQNPTKFELVVNLNAARAIGLAMPTPFLLRADMVIE